jgi:hypothetical protein
MRTIPHLLILIAMALLSSPASSTAQSSSDKKKPPKVIELSGCVAQDEKAPQQFVIKDAHEGIYRLSGKDFREYLGRSITVNGGVIVKGLAVKGGLTPNPNIAAQAGALDPSRAAVQAQVAEQTTGRDSDAALPEFRVKSVRGGSGPCK